MRKWFQDTFPQNSSREFIDDCRLKASQACVRKL